MARKRFVVEGEWTGYTSAQRRVVHRTVETLFRSGYEKLRRQAFGDGTSLIVSVRDAEPRERVEEIHGYDSLLREAAMRLWSKQKPTADRRDEHG